MAPASKQASRRITLGRRALLRAAAGLALAAPLAGCNVLRVGEPAGPVRLGISPGNQTLWRYLTARNPDLLRARGHVVSFHNVPSEDELQRGFVEGRYDAIATLLPAVPTLVEAGTAVKLFLPLAWIEEGFPLVVRDGSPVRSLADLPGRRVATYPLDHPGFAFWRTFLPEHHGLRGEEISSIETLEPHEQLASNAVEAAFVGGSGWAALQALGGYRKVADLRGEFRRLSGSERMPVFAGLVARADWIDGRERLVQDLTRAVNEGLAAYHQDRAAFLDTVTAEPSWAGLGRRENEAIARYLGYETAEPERAWLTAEDAADYARFFPLMAQAGLLKTPPPDAAALFYFPRR